MCAADPKADELFWRGLFTYVKKMLDIIYSKNIVEYLALYSEQKDAITSFYVSGILEIAKMYASAQTTSKEKCISYCRAIIGSAEDTRQMIIRFSR